MIFLFLLAVLCIEVLRYFSKKTSIESSYFILSSSDEMEEGEQTRNMMRKERQQLVVSNTTSVKYIILHHGRFPCAPKWRPFAPVLLLRQLTFLLS